jgi:hypothetical protein
VKEFIVMYVGRCEAWVLRRESDDTYAEYARVIEPSMLGNAHRQAVEMADLLNRATEGDTPT